MSKELSVLPRLYDLYAPLLTERQRELFVFYYNQDLSLSEIAENTGISRQGVHDAVKNAETALLQYEERLGFLMRLDRAADALNILAESTEEPLRTRIAEISAML
ncbi:MAG: YlxM family DNA-binding protein [Eubacteriales bacterium]|jgi:predicted DNA-binding protein YlxM (UPF0122 family)